MGRLIRRPPIEVDKTSLSKKAKMLSELRSKQSKPKKDIKIDFNKILWIGLISSFIVWLILI